MATVIRKSTWYPYPSRPAISLRRSCMTIPRSCWPGSRVPDRRPRRFFTRRPSIATSAMPCCGQSFAGDGSVASSGELVGAHTREFRKAWTSVHSNLEPVPQQTDQLLHRHQLWRRLRAQAVSQAGRRHQSRTRGAGVPVRGNIVFQRFLVPWARWTTAAPWESCPRKLASGPSAALYATRSTAGPTPSITWACSSNMLWRFRRTMRACATLKSPDLWAQSNDPVPPLIAELLGNYLDSIRTLARRTSELHSALSSRSRYPRLCA